MKVEYAKTVAGVLKNMQPRPISCISSFAILSKNLTFVQLQSLHVGQVAAECREGLGDGGRTRNH